MFKTINENVQRNISESLNQKFFGNAPIMIKFEVFSFAARELFFNT